ncbi:MAG: long-chain fatty acid--CoA ligase [Gemmatimonadota bacterium]|nr:long-chain fatty acid--CoA ligase [Gemmatimonadota bacterium]
MQGLMMDYPLTMERILEHANRLYPRKRISTVLPDETVHRYTWADLHSRSKRLASALEGLGIEPGDRVGTFAWNNYQHLELYFAAPCIGAVCHTLNIRLSPDQLAYIISHAEDRVIFVDATLLPRFEAVIAGLSRCPRIVLFNVKPGIRIDLPDAIGYEALIAGGSDSFEWPANDENAAMGLCYTSGTTGEPRGALYSHRSMFLHTLGVNQSNALGLVESDVVMPVVPQFHAMAWGLPYACAAAGAELVLPGPHLNPAALARTIADEGVTVAAGVPTIWTGLYEALKVNPRDVSSVRALIVGGAAMPRGLIEAYETELDVPVVHAWGMTELSPLGTVSRLQRHHRALPDADRWDVKARQGYPICGVDMRIVDDSGNEAPWDGSSMGEVQVRGPWVIGRYYRQDPSPDHFTADGWFRTGDVGSMSPDGFLTITDRTRDLIKSGGEWISSVALENALMDHPAVTEAAVIAVPDAKWTERPFAIAVRSPNADPVAAEALQALLASAYPKYWVPDRIVFVEQIPKTSVGKLDKKVIRRQYTEGKFG